MLTKKEEAEAYYKLAAILATIAGMAIVGASLFYTFQFNVYGTSISLMNLAYNEEINPAEKAELWNNFNNTIESTNPIFWIGNALLVISIVFVGGAIFYWRKAKGCLNKTVIETKSKSKKTKPSYQFAQIQASLAGFAILAATLLFGLAVDEQIEAIYRLAFSIFGLLFTLKGLNWGNNAYELAKKTYEKER